MSKGRVDEKNKKPSRLGRGIGSLISENTSVDMFSNDLDFEEPTTSRVIINKKEERFEGHTAPVQIEEKKPQIPDAARIWQVDIEHVFPNPNQPRKVFTEEALSELTASIKEKGILQPIVARKRDSEGYEIIAGERRWRAAQAAGLHQIPVITKETTNQEALELALIENIQRQDLNPLEEAEAYEHLMKEYNLTQQALAVKMGKERVTVANILRILNLSKDVKSLLRSQQLSLGQAKVLVSITDEKQQKKLARKAVDEKLSVRALEKLIKKANQIKNPPQKGISDLSVSDELLRSLSEDLQKCVGTKINIDYKAGKGKIAIHFYSDEELNNIVEKVKTGWQK